VKASIPFWLERIEAICKRDPEAARRAVNRHSENVQKEMRDSAQEDSPFANMHIDVDAK
jgi:DNA-binding FadR family transcriptional regulator